MVEADSEDEARELASSRTVGTMTHQPFTDPADEAWVTDELDGEPFAVMVVGKGAR